MVKIGDAVWFVDGRRQERPALVTAVWGPTSDGRPPSINVVVVSLDEDRRDQYGRQVERETSLVHEANQPAHGMFWRERT